MKRVNKKGIVLLAACLLLMVAVGGTIAYLMDVTEPLVNTFSPTDVGVDITDKIENYVKKDVVITNTGTASAYIRARIVGNWVDDAGKVIRGWKNTAAEGRFEGRFPGEGWVARDGYYYYTLPVAPGRTTSPLFTSYTVNPVEGEHLVMDILVQAIQADGNAAQAWGGIPPAPLPTERRL